MKLNFIIGICLLVLGFQSPNHAQTLNTEVLVIGGSASGVTAAIQSARMDVRTVLIEEHPWIGGMITAAGVSAFDGNHNLPSGLWKEFRDRLYQHYGGPGKVSTGWVSNTLFEPQIGDSILKAMVRNETQLHLMTGWIFESVLKKNNLVIGASFIEEKTGKKLTVLAKVVIDATELGDVLAKAGAAYDVGIDPIEAKREGIQVGDSKGIIQDLTYVAILKDYGAYADCTIVKPNGYYPEEFDGACKDYFTNTNRKSPTVDARTMLDYGKLPNGKYMINWPNYGNDFYFNPISLSQMQRDSGYALAKQQTLRFIYFIQDKLGFKNLGLADDAFPTADRLPWIPYHRESRRIKGVVRFDMVQLSQPFGKENALYRTGIAVGDYPIDHHHKKNKNAPQQLDFYPVPSFTIPLGSLLPEKIDGLVAAEKSISVSNVINGATRLQPCVMLIGQAAGTLSALSVKQKKLPREVSVREVQSELINYDAMLMPYMDVVPGNKFFSSIQKIGATGILRGKGVPYKWANQTWFYPQQYVHVDTLNINARGWLIECKSAQSILSVKEAIDLIKSSASVIYGLDLESNHALIEKTLKEAGLQNRQPDDPITREVFSYLLEQWIDPFLLRPVDHSGRVR